MGFLGFESKQEKEVRLKQLDLENKIKKLEAEKKGLPFFGTRYQDDYRIKEM